MSTPTQAPRYTIAKYLPEEARRFATTQVYLPTGSNVEQFPKPRDPAGYCPLGNALLAMGRCQQPEDGCPNPTRVSDLLGIHRIAVHRAAFSFIADWDEGLIGDLADAFGLLS
jgi:hypothetical protein